MTGATLRLDRISRRLGIAGAIGAMALAFAPGYYWTTVRPLMLEAETLAAKQAAAAQRHSPEAVASDPATSREEKLRAFHGFFPPQKAAPGWISKIFEAADTEKLTLERGDYRRTTVQAGESPAPLRIVLPVKGSYAQIRRFVTAALAEVPTLALEEIAFQRQSARDPRIEAEVRFVLYLGTEP